MKRTTMILGIIGLAVFLLFLAGCAGKTAPTDTTPPTTPDTADETADTAPEAAGWLDAELVDAVTGETFVIRDLPRPVLVESFAIWCPTCTKQQEILKDVESATHVSIDTDPNEDVEAVKAHAQQHGFDWHYAVSPGAVTQSLIDEFGIGVVNAPSVPIVLVCGDDSTHMLGRGLKQASELEAAIAERCEA